MLRWSPWDVDSAATYAEEESPVASTDEERRWTLLLAAFVVTLTFVIHNASPNVTVADSIRFVPAAESLVSRGSFDVRWSQDLPNGGSVNSAMYQEPDNLSAPVYPYYPLGPVLVAVPVVALGHLIHSVGLTESVESELRQFGTWRYERLIGSLVVAATTAAMFAVTYLWLSGTVRRRRVLAAGVALTFAFATPAWTTGSRALWQHGPVMLVLSLAVLIGVRARTNDRPVALLGVVLGLAYVIRPTSSVAIIAFTAWVAIYHRRRALAYLAGLAAVLGGLALVNLHLYGDVLSPYYRPGREGRNPKVLEALVGNLVSPGRGMFMFSPILLLAFFGLAVRVKRREADGLDFTIWIVLVGHWIAISIAAPQWWGGYTIGPRLFSDIVPLLVFAALPMLEWTPPPGGLLRVRQAAVVTSVAVLALFSVAIEAEGATMRSMWCWNKLRDIDGHPEYLWDLRDGQLFAGIDAIDRGHTWRSETEPGAATTTDCTGDVVPTG